MLQDPEQLHGMLKKPLHFHGKMLHCPHLYSLHYGSNFADNVLGVEMRRFVFTALFVLASCIRRSDVGKFRELVFFGDFLLFIFRLLPQVKLAFQCQKYVVVKNLFQCFFVESFFVFQVACRSFYAVDMFMEEFFSAASMIFFSFSDFLDHT